MKSFALFLSRAEKAWVRAVTSPLRLRWSILTTGWMNEWIFSLPQLFPLLRTLLAVQIPANHCSGFCAVSIRSENKAHFFSPLTPSCWQSLLLWVANSWGDPSYLMPSLASHFTTSCHGTGTACTFSSCVTSQLLSRSFKGKKKNPTKTTKVTHLPIPSNTNEWHYLTWVRQVCPWNNAELYLYNLGVFHFTEVLNYQIHFQLLSKTTNQQEGLLKLLKRRPWKNSFYRN